MTDFTIKARKLAGILAVPAWRAALRRHRVTAGVENRLSLIGLEVGTGADDAPLVGRPEGRTQIAIRGVIE